MKGRFSSNAQSDAAGCVPEKYFIRTKCWIRINNHQSQHNADFYKYTINQTLKRPTSKMGLAVLALQGI
jgi:hypothetical protein